MVDISNYAGGLGSAAAVGSKGVFKDAQGTLTGTFHSLIYIEWVGLSPIVREIVANF